MHQCSRGRELISHAAHASALSTGIECTVEAHWLVNLKWASQIFAAKSSAQILHFHAFASTSCTCCASTDEVIELIVNMRTVCKYFTNMLSEKLRL